MYIMEYSWDRPHFYISILTLHFTYKSTKLQVAVFSMSAFDPQLKKNVDIKLINPSNPSTRRQQNYETDIILHPNTILSSFIQ